MITYEILENEFYFGLLISFRIVLRAHLKTTKLISGNLFNQRLSAFYLIKKGF